MATFKEANQVRLSLKMTLSQHAWYYSSQVLPDEGDYYILVLTNSLNNHVRKIIPQVINCINIKTELK